MTMQRCVFLFLATLLCMAAAACTAPLFRNYGQISINGETTKAFENYRVNSELRYYISGSDLYPNALMGLHRDYRLDPKTLWKEVVMTPEKMKEIVENMKTKAFESRQFPHGFELHNEKGQAIGVWYSILSARTFLHMEENGTVRINTPDLETYEKLEIEEEKDN